MAEVTLEALGALMQRSLDSQTMLRADVRQMRRKLDRIERAILALQRSDIDRTEHEADIDAQMETLERRIERLGG